MKQDFITPHETVQLHELLTLKCLSLTKSIAMSPLIADPDLKAIFKRESDICESHINELRSYMDKPSVTSYQGGGMFSESGVNA